MRSNDSARPTVNSPTLTAFAPSPATTTTPAAPVATVAQSVTPSINDLWAKYDATNATNNPVDFAVQDLKATYGTSTNNSLLTNLENPNSFYAKNLAAAEATSNPDAYLKSVGYNQQVVDQMTDYYDAKQLAQHQYADQQTQYAKLSQANQNIVTDAQQD